LKKSVKIWLVGWTLLWLSFVVAFLIDYFGIAEANNTGFLEIIWISWILWTVGLGLTLAILTRFIVKE
jgi:cytochrome c oxidase subunit IV